MDKIEKILRLLSPKERQAMLLLMQALGRNYRSVPGVKPLHGMKGWFRARMGQYRIIFVVNGNTVEIRRISRRNEGTYKKLG